MTSPKKRHWSRRLMHVVGGLFAVLFVALLVVGFLIDLGSVVQGQIRNATPKLQEKLGRTLNVGSSRLKLLPEARLELHNISIEAEPSQVGQPGILGQPLLRIGLLRARVAVGPLLWSFGRRIEVTAIEVSDLNVQVVRMPDGQLSYQDILDKQATQTESPPMTQDEIDKLAGIILHHTTLSSSALLFYDLSKPYGGSTPLKIDNIDFTVEEAQLFAPFKLTLDMAVLAPQRNFHLGMTVGPLPHDLQVTQPAAILQHVDFALQPLEIEPLLDFLPDSPGVSLAKAQLEAQLNLETPAQSGQLKLQATVKAHGLVLEQGNPKLPPAARRGQSTDVSIAVGLAANVLAGDLQVEKLDLGINDMTVSGQADLHSLWTAPTVNRLSLSSRGLLLEKLLAVLPPAALPPNTILRGPLVVRGSASGTPTAAQVEMAIDLTPATIDTDSFDKPEGTPLSLELRGQVKGQGQGADIERLGFTLGPMALLLKGQVRSAEDLDLKLDTGTIDLDKLLPLLPTVKKSVRKGGRIDGDLRVVGTIKKLKDTLDVGARVTMKDARIDEGDLDLRGSSELHSQIHSTPTAANIDADLDLTGTQLRLPGKVDKQSGVPMRLRAQIERTGRVINVRLGELTLPGGTLRIAGTADQGKNQLNMKIPLVELDLSRLAQVLPALRKGSGGGLLDSKLKLAASFDGNPNKLSGARAKLEEFDMSVAGGTLKGTAEIIGLDEPRKLTFNFVGERLDLDRIAGHSDDSAEPEHHAAASAQPNIPPFLRRLDMTGRVQIDSGRYKGTALKDFLLEVTMSGGKLLLKTLRAQAFEGNINASGSTVDLGPSRPRFALKAKLDRIQIADVMALRGGGTPDRRLTGRGSLDLSADGQGLAWEDIAPKVTGQLGLGFADGKLEGAGMVGQVINPLIAHVGKQFAGNTNERDMTLRNLSAQFHIDGGRLHTQSPMRITTDEGTLSLEGSIGLDKSLAMTGNLEVAPATISKATAGRLVPDSAIPVSLRISGALSEPRFELVDLARTGAALLGAIMRGRGKELLSGLAAGHPGLPNLGALGGQPTPGQGKAPPVPAGVEQRLQEAGKKGLGGLFGR